MTSLWRPDALTNQAKADLSDLAFFKRYGGGSILVPTTKSADDAWTHRTAPRIPVPKDGEDD